MKFMKRAKLISVSALLVMASLTTWFTGCGKKQDDPTTNEPVNDNATTTTAQDYEELSAGYAVITPETLDDYGDEIEASQFDPTLDSYNLFAYEPDKKSYDALITQGKPVDGELLFGQNQVYKKDNGEYFIIDGDEALTVEKTSDGKFILPDKVFNGEDSRILYKENTNEGIIVFKNDDVYKQMFDTLQKQVDSGMKPFVLNGKTVKDKLETKDVSTIRNTEVYYCLNTIVDTFNAFARTNPNRYGTMQIDECDESFVTITRQLGSKVITETLPCSSTGNLFLYTGQLATQKDHTGTTAVIFSCPVIEDNQCFVSSAVLSEIFGIDIIDGFYHFAPTNTDLPAYIGLTTGKQFNPVVQESDKPAVTTTTPKTTEAPKVTTTPKQTQAPSTTSNGKKTESSTTTPKQTQAPSTSKKETQPKQTQAPSTSKKETQAPSTQPKQTQAPSTQPKQTQAPSTSKKETQAPVTDPPATQPPVTEPPQTEPPVTDPPATEPPATDTEPARTVIDGHGNVYDEAWYSKIGEVCFLTGKDGYEDAQNYAAAIEAYYGIPMSVSGSAVCPSCYENLETVGTLEELNAWRAGRSPAEIGPAELSSNWSLIRNDIDFFYECMDYLESLQLARDFLVFN